MKEGILRRALVLVMVVGLVVTACGPTDDSGDELETAVSEALRATERAEEEIGRRVEATLTAEGGLGPEPGDEAREADVVAEAEIRAAEGGIVELGDGARVAIPPGALGTDQPVRLSRLEAKPAGDEGTFGLPGQAYEIETREAGFSRPVQITLPYDERLLPADRTEGEIFAVVLIDGEWQRIEGHLDKELNTITVEVYRASIWSWATELYANAVETVAR